MSRKSSVDVPCVQCGIIVSRQPNELRHRPTTFCSHACYSANLASKPDDERFWSKVAKGDGCWLWHGATTKAGYGIVYTKRGRQYAHRLSWELGGGANADGLVICHHCDTPACVRPDHLFLGTHADNQADKVRKGRAMQKLTRTQVDEIREAYERGDASQYKLAARYGVTQTTVSGIISRRIHRIA